MRHVEIVLLMLCLSACASMHSNSSHFSVPNEIAYLSNEAGISFPLLDSIMAMPPTIIPALIKGITDDSDAWVGVVDPSSSYLGPYFALSKNRKGIINAFLIDFYLFKDRIGIIPASIIVKLDAQGNEIMAPLSKRDMRIIQKQYQAWWNEHKDLPIETLREEFHKSGILKPPYVWR